MEYNCGHAYMDLTLFVSFSPIWGLQVGPRKASSGVSLSGLFSTFPIRIGRIVPSLPGKAIPKNQGR